MNIEEMQTRLHAFLDKLPASGFEAIADGDISELESLAGEADSLGMKSAKQLTANLVQALKARKNGENTDESVQLRITALDFYVQKLQQGTTEDL